MARTIVIADDNEVNRRALRAHLRKDFNVLEIQDRAELFTILEKNRALVSAVLVSTMSTVINGYKILEEIRAVPDYRSIPIILITANDKIETIKKTVESGANGILTKPFDFDLLKKNLENAISICENASLVNVLSRDKLTGLLCPELFFSECDKLIQNHEPGFYTMSCLDIEHFKVINDQYGMNTGDEVLKHVADCIRSCCDEVEGLGCRFSADRFAVLYPRALINSSLVLKGYQRAAEPPCINNTIRIRVGRYLIKDKAIPANIIFERATVAEESIKGRYDLLVAEYSDSMRDRLLYEQKIVNDMNRALIEGQFIPYLQPQYNHATGAIIGAEALVRWKKDEKLISPVEFVPIFEKNGFIYEVDKDMWEKICILLRKWLDEGKHPLPISVNISRLDFFKDDFFDTICGLVNKYRIPTDLLRLEVTESAFTDSAQHVVGSVNRLIHHGFTVEIDDFGSGYSSLNTLKDVQSSIIKLDMRFFTETENSDRSGNIIESVVRMAKWLGMAVIAEGVEKLEQADYLKSIGCYYIQGYYYAKPMSVKDYEALFDKKEHEHRLTRLKTVTTFENSQFWNPESMETLIFNSYVGGACILEQYKGGLELLRVNNQYLKEMRSVITEEVSLASLNPAVVLDAENFELLNRTIAKAIKTKNEAFCELEIPNDGKTSEYIRCNVRLIASTLERNLIYCVILNLTEQRETERKLIESERKKFESMQQLKFIMDNINGGVSAIQIHDDRSSSLVFCNERYYDLYGYSKKQAEEEKLDVISRIAADDVEMVLEKVKLLKTDGRPTLIDYRITKRDGSRALLRANASLMRLEGYEEAVITSIITDITELRSLEDKFQAIVKNINGGVTATVVRNKKPEFIVFNQQFFTILGYDTMEQYEMECPDKFSRIHPDDKERIIQQFLTEDGGKKQYTMEYRIIRRDGEIRYIQNHISVVYLFGVEEPVQLSVAYDVTERYHNRAHIQSMEQELKTLLESIPSGVMKYAADAGGQFEYVNSNFIHNLGYSEDQFREKFHNSFHEMVWQEDRERVQYEINTQETDGNIGKFDFRIEAIDGRLHWFHDEGIKVTDNAGREWYYVTLVDITKGKETEENLRILEEEYRITAQHSGRTIGRYDISKMTLTITSEAAKRLLLPECIEDVPYGRVKLGIVSSDTKDAYTEFYRDIMNGKPEGTVMFQKKIKDRWRWISAHFTTIYAQDGKPVSAIISFIDISDQYNKDIITK